ncbi:hypothetical protein ABPG75_006418 [Micractinium tetrahymenae]
MLCAARVSFAPSLAPRAGRRALSVRASGAINPDIKKDVEKVVDTVVVPADLGGKPQAAYCRCWRSKKFPACDGSHVAHNKDTGDNVSPAGEGRTCLWALGTGIWQPARRAAA